MTTLLDQAIAAARRLPPGRQNSIAEALLALIEQESRPPCDLPLPGGDPSEDEILALMPFVKPSAVPTKAEAAAWNRLPEEEQLRRLRNELDHPDGATVTGDTVQDIFQRVLKRHGH